MRLDRLLANMGIGSRRDVKKMIAGGSVSVNGKILRDPGFEVDAERDVVSFRGEIITYKKYVYLMMNKPSGVLSCGDGAPGVKEAKDLVGEDYGFYDLSPAGRLDVDSEGLLILTNDGEFIHNVISPAKKVDKVYYIKTSGELDPGDVDAFEKGVDIGGNETAKSAKLEILNKGGGSSEALVTVSEGRFHQVKRMVKACGKTVVYLKRLSVGGVKLDGSLEPGQYRHLTDEELGILMSRADKT